MKGLKFTVYRYHVTSKVCEWAD